MVMSRGCKPAGLIKRSGVGKPRLSTHSGVRKPRLSIYCLLFIVYCSLFTVSYAADHPFTGPANYGGTGLMETPTARIMREGRVRLGVGQVDPYRFYYGAISPFKFLEINGRVTEIFGTGTAQTGLPADYGNYKDKAVDLKLQVLPEGKWWPAVALGLADIQGNRLYGSQYLVASKQFYPFDFTIGFGNGRYGKRPLPALNESMRLEIFQENASWHSDGQFFGGVQLAVTDYFTVMAEYSPIQYEKQTQDPAQAKYFSTAVFSKINFGLRWKPWDWLEADVSYQRGNQVGVNVSMAFDLGAPMIPLYDQAYRERAERQSSPMEGRVTAALEATGFSNIGIRIDGGDLWIEAQNDKYYYTPRAIAMVLQSLAGMLGRDEPHPPLHSPPEGGKNNVGIPLKGRGGDSHIENVHLILSNKGIPVVQFSTTREDILNYYEEKFTLGEFLQVSKITTDVRENLPVRHTNRNWWDWGLRPSFQTLLNDPSGFFKYRFGAAGWVSLSTWRGASFVAGLEGYPFNNISSANAPSSQPVRTDTWLYKKENVNMGILLFEQIEKFPYSIYGRVAAGYLELQYGGVDAEIAKPLFNGRLMVGLSGSVVKKREVDSVLQYKQNDWKDHYKTAFVNTRLNIPEAEAAIDLKAGQFLAGDQGTRLMISKSFNGIILSAWYSFTDTSMFKDSFNSGYHDKGIAISIPLRMFKGSDSRTSYLFGLSPWTRDVAADIDHFTSLFDFIGRNAEMYLEKDMRTKGIGP